MEAYEVDKKLSQVRPRLITVSPLVAKIIMQFSVLNLLIGYYLYKDGGTITRSVAIINKYTTVQFYGVIFMLIGAMMAYGYIVNNWNLLKRLLLLGIMVKAIWLIALVILAVKGSNPFVLLIWSFLLSTQFFCYIHFIPSGRRKDDE